MSVNTEKLEMLGKDNYDTWAIQMEAILIKNDEWEYVSGLRPCPEDKNSRTEWETQDRKAKSDIILGILPSELKQIKGCSTSKEVWEKLKSIYLSQGPARKATLLKQLMLRKLKSGEDVIDHLRNFFDIIDKLQEMDIEINKDLLSVILLYSLPDEYEGFRVAIESRDTLPDPEALKLKIIEESEARNRNTSVTDSEALFVRRGLHPSPNYKFWKKNNQPQPQPQFKYQCHRCKKRGHKAAECHLKGKQSASLGETSFHSNSNSNISLIANTQQTSHSEWCLDSGCTSHMIKEKSVFNNFSISQNKSIDLANNSTAQIRGEGNVEFFVNNGAGERVKLKVPEVLYVPDLRTNLLSVAKITDKNYQVTFKKDKAEIIDPSGRVIIKAPRINNLYLLKEIKEELRESSQNVTLQAQLKLWHERYGHLNERDLKVMIKKGSIPERRLINERLPICETCLKGKMHRTPFLEKPERKTNKLDIIHTDICGPISTESNGGAKYFITFIDDSSRYCVVKFLKKKNDAFTAFKNFKNEVEKKTKTKIKCLQSDNGNEFCNKEFNEYLKKEGISRRLSAPYTLQQNGVAERLNRTLVEMARCMLNEYNLPRSFWAEAINTACHIRNRCPTGSEKNTPYKRWTGRNPTVRYFRKFGCKAFMLDKRPNRRKLDQKSHECIFLGYSDEHKAYRLWLIDQKVTRISRDVAFMEQTAPTFSEKLNKEEHWLFYEEPKNVQKDTGNLFPEEEKETGSVQKENENDILDEGEESDPYHKNTAEKGKENQPESKRGQGRPRKWKTGGKGRPRKIYCKTPKPREDYGQVHDESINMADMTPKNIFSAFHSPWKKAVIEEFESLIKNDSWTLVDRPKNQKLIDSRLILKEKLNEKGEITRRKARLVARGFSQVPGIDFFETYFPVVRLSSLRTLVGIAAAKGFKIRQLDIKTAYLNGELEEKIYMEPPESLDLILGEMQNSSEKDLKKKAINMRRELRHGEKVCLLQKSLYGLKQSGRQWYSKLHFVLLKIGFEPSETDPCVYILKNGKDLMYLAVYVDDLILFSDDNELTQKIIYLLKDKFEVKDLGHIHHCLGLEFKRTDDEIFISQKNYILEI